MATPSFPMVIAVLWEQFRSKAQSPLNLPSDVLGQTALRAWPDRRGYSSSGRNRSRYEARGFQRVGMERFTHNMTLLINVARQEQKGRTRHSQRVHVGQLVVLPQNRAKEERPSSRDLRSRPFH